MTKQIRGVLGLLLLTVVVTTEADWVVEENKPFVGGYSVVNDKTGQRLNTRYKTEKAANKAAKALNKADKSVMAGPNGEGDYRPGGELPR